MSLNKKLCINFLFLATVFFFLEIISRYGFLMFPMEDYQRYGHVKIEDTMDENDSHRMKINGRGAIGALFQKQKIEISFFGNSSLFFDVPQSETWPEQLKIKFGKEKLHIDNFAVASNNIYHIKRQIKSLCKLKRFYDIVVIQYTMKPFTNPDLKYYHNQWLPDTKVQIQIIQKIKEWISGLTENNLFYNFFPQMPLHIALLGMFYDALDNISYTIHPDNNIQNLLDNLYLTMLKENFILDYLYSKELKQLFDERKSAMTQSISTASCITDNIIWLPELVRITEKTLKHYEKYYFSFSEEFINQLLPVVRESIGQGVKALYKLTAEELTQNKNVIFIDWRHIFNKGKSSDDFFIDIHHLSAQGHKAASEYMYPIFKEILKDNL